MQLDELIKRLRIAAQTKSLRALGKECEVSHELIRKLLKADNEVSITVASYNKIDKGLRSNGI